MLRAVGGWLPSGRGFEMDALSADVMGEYLAELILGNLAEIGGLATEIGDAGGRIAGAAAGGLHRGAHHTVKPLGTLRIDQVHGALGDGVVDQELVVAARNNVDDRIADRQDIELAHGVRGSVCLARRS